MAAARVWNSLFNFILTWNHGLSQAISNRWLRPCEHHAQFSGITWHIMVNLSLHCRLQPCIRICPIMWKYGVVQKPEIHNILQCQQRTEPCPQVTENSVSLVMWFLCYVSIQTERHARLQYCAALLKAKWQHSSAHTHQFQLLCYSCCFLILIILCIGCLLFLCSLTSISKTETVKHISTAYHLVLHSMKIRYNRLVVLHTVEAFRTNENKT